MRRILFCGLVRYIAFISKMSFLVIEGVTENVFPQQKSMSADKKIDEVGKTIDKWAKRGWI